MTTTPTTARDTALQLLPDPLPAPQCDHGARLGERRAEPGANTAASIAAGVTVLVCVLARLPNRLIHMTGLRGWMPALVGVIVLVNGARALAQAPFTFARRPASVTKWVRELLTTLAGTLAVGVALTLPLYALLRATSAWWLWAWAMFAGVTVAGQVAMPLIVRVHAGPLVPAAPPFDQRVREIAALAGVDVGGGVLVAGPAASAHPRCNAYVVGLGPTRRVVLERGVAAWPPELIDQVVAHEIGHWRLRHAAGRLPFTIVAQLGTFALAATVLSLPPLLEWAGVANAGDPRSYPLLLALTGMLALPARLLLACYDRAQERAADRFALGVLDEPEVFAAMLDRAARDGGAPRQLSWWRHVAASHPPVDERIRACRSHTTAVSAGATAALSAPVTVGS